MDKKAKILMSLALIASIGCVSGVAYAAYNVTGTSSTILPISVSKINIDRAPISFNMSSVSNLSVTTKHDFIVNDTLSIKFAFDDSIYDSSRNALFDYAFGGLKFTFSISNQRLYDHLKNEFVMKKDAFSVMSGPNKITYVNSGNYQYKKQNVLTPCFSNDDTTKKINIMLPISSDVSNLNTHCIRHLDPNGRVASVWDFTCSFDFGLIEQGEEFAKEFKGADLALSSLNISLENLK